MEAHSQQRQQELITVFSQSLQVPGQHRPVLSLLLHSRLVLGVSLNKMQGLVQHKSHTPLSIFRAVLLR